MEKIRIQKFFTDNAVMSRRAAEAAIEAGRVYVNGNRALIGQKIDPECDSVTLDGKLIEPTAPKKTYIMLNKPRGYVTTLSDERGRPTVAKLVADCGTRVYPVGRLDMDSEGLLLLTNDGELTLRLTHPRHEIPKIYHVTLRGEVSDRDIEQLKSVRRIDNYDLAPVGIRMLSRTDKSSCVEFTLHEGRNRQIRKMCEAVSLHITRLQRVAIGELKLGDLPLGHWRHLTQQQIDYLYEKECKK
ncbi:MAG: rRNA pseudouridine synthase [Clostridia bacterium]|nr:rRNA pseudouridine synthase [Clostridia bacterium]